MHPDFMPHPWPPRQPLELAPGQIDVWWFAASAMPSAIPREQLLRATLAAYADRPADQLALARSARGKPQLANLHGLEFNLSDCHHHVLLALTSHGPIGVDLERTDRTMDALGIARRWFDPREITALEALSGDARQQAFLHLWTAKEAACKATGTGISGHLGQWCFAVGVEQPHLLRAPDDACPGEPWRFARLTPAPGFTAVVASRGPSPAIRSFHALPQQP